MFPGGPVVKTLHFQCRGHEFDPWLGNWDPTCRAAQPKKTKKTKPRSGSHSKFPLSLRSKRLKFEEEITWLVSNDKKRITKLKMHAHEGFASIGCIKKLYLNLDTEGL